MKRTLAYDSKGPLHDEKSKVLKAEDTSTKRDNQEKLPCSTGTSRDEGWNILRLLMLAAERRREVWGYLRMRQVR